LQRHQFDPMANKTNSRYNFGGNIKVHDKLRKSRQSYQKDDSSAEYYSKRNNEYQGKDKDRTSLPPKAQSRFDIHKDAHNGDIASSIDSRRLLRDENAPGILRSSRSGVHDNISSQNQNVRRSGNMEVLLNDLNLKKKTNRINGVQLAPLNHPVVQTGSHLTSAKNFSSKQTTPTVIKLGTESVIDSTVSMSPHRDEYPVFASQSALQAKTKLALAPLQH
jgi:hypothetical protein